MRRATLISAALAATLLLSPIHAWSQGAASVAGESRFVQELELEPGNTLFELEREQVGDSTIYRYQQRYMDIPVHGRHITVRESAEGDTMSKFGSVVEGLSTSLPYISPIVTEIDATRAARRAFRATHSSDYRFSRRRVRLEILADEANDARLVYVITFLAQGEALDPMVPLSIVDASTGEVLRQYDTAAGLKVGTGPGGNPNTGLVEYGRNADFLDVRKVDNTCYLQNRYVRVVNMHGLPGYPFTKTHSFECPRNEVKPANGAYAPMNDLLYYGTSVFDMYRVFLGKRVLPAPFKVQFRAHYNNRATAVWAGKENMVLIGNGNDENYPLAVMDVVSHELAHGFTDYNSGLNRDWTKESSAIDESFADIAGEAFEFYMRGTNNFLLGDDSSKSGTPARDMRHPTRFGNSIDHIDDYEAEIKIAPDGKIDPHRASGIYNKAFYLIATSPGWDTKQAFILFARANDWYWSPDTNFEQGACIVIRTAAELGYPTEPVVDAFQEVGISCGVQWEESTATGFYKTRVPRILDGGKTLASSPEPVDGLWAYAARTDKSISSGKRYIELKIGRQRSASVYSYSGLVSIVLQTKEHGVGLDVDYTVGQMMTLGWPLEVDSDPASAGEPWLWAKWDQNAVYNLSPLGKVRVSEGDIIGVAVDFDNGKVWYSLNGVWKGNPVTGEAPAFDQGALSPDYHFTGRELRIKALSEFSDFSVTLQASRSELSHPLPGGYKTW